MRQFQSTPRPRGQASMGRMSGRPQARGVTLIEMVTVLAIVALLATFGMTGLAETVARHRVQTTLHQISADLAMARNTAITRRAQVVACPGDALLGCRGDADWSSGWIVFHDPDGNRRPDAEIDLVRVSNAPSGAPGAISLRSTRNFVRYQRDGRSAGTNLTIHVCHKDTLAGQVIVNNLGRVRSTRPAREGSCPH